MHKNITELDLKNQKACFVQANGIERLSESKKKNQSTKDETIQIE
jgi:hypothetical protein